MEFLCKAEADVVLLNETWAHSDDALPNLPNLVQWSIARPKANNKRGKHAGGVAMYIKDKYAKQMTLIATDARNDKIWVKLDKAVSLGEDLYLCLLYLPPEKTAASKPFQAKIGKTYETLTEEILREQEKG
jgi:exonuclease III